MKAIIAAPFVPISMNLASHRSAQAMIYADMIGHIFDTKLDVSLSRPNVQGEGAIAENRLEDFNEYDTLFIYHGNDRPESSKGVNLFGGVKEFPHAYNIANISKFKGDVYSIAYDMPDYAGIMSRKIGTFESKNPDLKTESYQLFKSTDFDNLRKMQERAITCWPAGPWNKLVVGDSHAICMYRPGWNVNSIPFKTLHGALNEGLDSFIDENDCVTDVEFYFGNIDIRHHVCRLENTKEVIEKLVDKYVEQVNNMNYKSKAIYELLPIENERRNIPKTGHYEGKPFWGSWAERNEARLYFNSLLESKTQNTDIEFKRWITKDYYNDKGEMDFKVMERPKSVHLSREYYPYWQGLEYNGIHKPKDLESFFQ